MKTARRQAREIALQALYAWQLSGDDPLEQARSIEGFDKTDARFVENVLRGVLGRAEELRGTDGIRLGRDRDLPVFEHLGGLQAAGGHHGGAGEKTRGNRRGKDISHGIVLELKARVAPCWTALWSIAPSRAVTFVTLSPFGRRD